MHKIAILTYHGVSYKPEGKYNLSIGEFTRQMHFLHEMQYRTLTLDELNNIKYNTPGLFYSLTFDDGDKSNFEIVLPIIEKYGYKATFFVTAGLIERNKSFMDWREINELLKRGHIVQSHGYSHRFLNCLCERDTLFELEESRDIIKRSTNYLPNVFSCPGGRYNKKVIKIAKDIGYEKMLNSEPRYFTPEQDNNNFTSGRFIITRGMDLNRFRKIMEGDGLLLYKLRAEYHIKNFLKMSIGDNLYHMVYSRTKNE